MNKSQTHEKHTSRRQVFRAAIMLLLLNVICGHAAAQNQPAPSTDRDNPAQLASNVITGDGVDGKTEYFYAFTAGPGEIKLTLDVKAEKSTAVSSVDIALFDANSRKLLSTYANPDHGSSKRAVESAKVRGEQTLLLEVTVSQGVDNFKIKLDGAVKIASSTSGATDSSTSGGGTAPPDAPPSQLQSAGGNAASNTTDNSTAASASDAAASGANANATGTNTASTGTDASQTSASASSNGSKVGKANAKVNSASSTLSAIITSAGATADSVKNVKKKKKQ